jgi:hypothetical protein
VRLRTAQLLLIAFVTATVLPGMVAAAEHARSFTVYDNMFYRGKPNTAAEGLQASNILYENLIWPDKKELGILPNRNAFAALVRSHIANPGPLVIDIEQLPLKGSSEAARHNMEILATLADWAHEAAPGKVIGYYGTNTLTKVPPSNLALARELARHVDAFFPPMYTFDDDHAKWEQRAQAEAAEARDLDPSKPVYFYLWPQYHDGTPRAFEFIAGAYWKFQLETSRRYCNGIVLWSPSRYDWDNSTSWWSVTREFLHSQN